MPLLKIGVPHSSTIPNPTALVYDHTREIFKTLPITKYLMQVMAGRFQIFVEGELSEDSEIGIKIDKVVELSDEEVVAFERVGRSISELEALDAEVG
jgi:hypothetical protein